MNLAKGLILQPVRTEQNSRLPLEQDEDLTGLRFLFPWKWKYLPVMWDLGSTRELESQDLQPMLFVL